MISSRRYKETKNETRMQPFRCLPVGVKIEPWQHCGHDHGVFPFNGARFTPGLLRTGTSNGDVRAPICKTFVFKFTGAEKFSLSLIKEPTGRRKSTDPDY